MKIQLLVLSVMVAASLVSEALGTVIVGTGVGVGSAAGAVGLAALIGLKVAAVAGIAVAHGLRGRQGRGNRRRFRGRRDADQDAEELEDDDAYFRTVEEMDTMGCGLKVVCELEARNYDQLQADEQLILSLFGSQPHAPSFQKLTETARGKYDLAAFVGAERKDVEECVKFFHQCPFSTDDLMNQLRSVRLQ